jgi:hypothetical protein
MFYHLFRGRVAFGRLNRKLSVYLALFRRMARNGHRAVLVTSFARARRVVSATGEQWLRGYSGGRVLKRACDILLTVTRAQGSVDVVVTKHYDAALHRKVLRTGLV